MRCRHEVYVCLTRLVYCKGFHNKHLEREIYNCLARYCLLKQKQWQTVSHIYMTRLFNNSNLTHRYLMRLHISNIYELTHCIINSQYQKIKEWVQAMDDFKETNNMSQRNPGESYRWVRQEDETSSCYRKKLCKL